MSKICMIIPFKYMWNNSSLVRNHYELLQENGYQVELFDLSKQHLTINYNNYKQICLMGSSAKLSKVQFNCCSVPVIAFGLSDPGRFSQEHYENCNFYFTNDLNTYQKYKNEGKIYYHPASCNKKVHINWDLEKTTDILTFGIGNHLFIKNRNQTVNELRQLGFKIKVLGRGWDQHPDTHGFIEGKQLIEEINKAHVVLDIATKTSSLAHRIFESSCCATPVLTEDRKDIRQLFISGHEILTYNSFENIVTTLNYVLNKKKLLKQIGLNAQKRCYQDHNITTRIQKILEIINYGE